MELKDNPPHRVIVEATWDRPAVPAIPMTDIELKRVLVPVDFSESSRKALRYAISFARVFNAEIYLLHVVQVLPAVMPGLVGEGVAGPSELREEAAKHLALWCRAIDAQIPVRAGIEEGAPADVIVRSAREHRTDMIITATHGRTGIERLLFGSTVRKIMHLAPCPILVISDQEHDFLVPAQGRPATRKNSRLGARRGTRPRRK